MDTDPGAPADFTLDEQKPKGTPEHELAPRSAPICRKPRSPKSPSRKRTRQPKQNGRFASQNLPPPRPPDKPPAKSDRILPPLRFPRPPLIGMRRLRLKSRLPHPHSPQPPPTRSLNPNLSHGNRSVSPAGRSASARNRADQRRHHGCRRAHRRLPTSSDTIPTPNPRGAGGSTALSPAIPSANRFAVKTILDTLRGPQDQTRAAPPASTLSPEKAGATASTNATRAPTTNAAASPGGLRDKLATFTAERMQPRRDAEQVRGVTQAATGIIASLQALEQQETTGILTRIRDAAKTNGGIENVLSEMRPGGQFEDLRKEFNTVLSHDQGFAAAYDKTTGAIADYAETRAAGGLVAAPRRPKPRPPANPRPGDRRGRENSSRN